MIRTFLLSISIIFVVACQSVKHQESEHSPSKLSSNSVPLEHELCMYSCPVGTDESDILVDHEIYLLSANRKTKFADWVAYKVLPENLQGGTHRRNWKKDSAIPDEFTLAPADYQGAYGAYQYDRGHQAPLADFSNHPAWERTNYLSNITPQKSNLNQGPWARLESKERALAQQRESVYILTGPVYLEPMPSLPNARLTHQVPSGYWKIIAVQDEPNARMRLAGFYLTQDTPRRADYCDYNVELDHIETLTGLSFFVAYPHSDTTSLSADLGC